MAGRLSKGSFLFQATVPEIEIWRSVVLRMSLLHFRCKERRRTQRVSLTIPLVLNGQNEDSEKFSVRAKTNAVSQHGAQIETEHPLIVGQTLLLVNESSARKVEARVVSIQRKRDGKTYIGVEFLSTDINFWNMTFPLPGAKPLRRVDSKVAANKVTA
jgi:PilZ domain-containing protein